MATVHSPVNRTAKIIKPDGFRSTCSSLTEEKVVRTKVRMDNAFFMNIGNRFSSLPAPLNFFFRGHLLKVMINKRLQTSKFSFHKPQALWFMCAEEPILL